MSLLEPGLAFLEGVALIVSPCILPVLPLVLSASVEGGRKRPFGIIAGFVLAFTAFALLSRQVVTALHIDLDVIKNFSLVLLALFGLVLLSERLSQRFSQWTQGAASLGGTLSSRGGDGFLSGMAIGALIGLVWTPCAGPILAAVLVQVIRQHTDLQGTLVIVAFALGAGVPMLLIALLGRKAIGRLGFFTTHAEAVRKAFGVLILLSVAFLASGVDAQSLFHREAKRQSDGALQLEQGLAQSYPAPEFAGIDGWINSEPLTMAQLRGHVVLVDFWTYSCINCVRTLPYLTAWDAKYRDQGLVIVGVHAPEFEFEKNKDNVQNAVHAHGIHYPVALDNHLDTWSNFHNRYWPAHYLIDRNGQVVYTHFGEGDYDVTENNIRFLLDLKDKAQSAAEPATANSSQTPETYLGTHRRERFDSDASALPINHWTLQGAWNATGENIVSAQAGAALRLHFHARHVFLVLGTASGQPVSAQILLNGKPPGAFAGRDTRAGKVTVARNSLYELIDQKQPQDGVLDLQAQQPGLEAYAFTFGN